MIGKGAMDDQESQSEKSLQGEQTMDESLSEGGLPPVYHHEIWDELVETGSMNGLLRYGMLNRTLSWMQMLMVETQSTRGQNMVVIRGM